VLHGYFETSLSRIPDVNKAIAWRDPVELFLTVFAPSLTPKDNDRHYSAASYRVSGGYPPT
jgi:hypothetical protein